MRYLPLALLLAACGTEAPSTPADVPGTDVAPLVDEEPPLMLFTDTGAPEVGRDVDGPDVAEAAVDVAVADARDAPDAAEVTPSCVDRDGDGYGSNCARGPDCDDGDALRHPGAGERCNGLDDDCNGVGDVARSDALDAWCTALWRAAYTRRNLDPIRDTSACLIPPVINRPGQLNCHPAHAACAAMAYNPTAGCTCFTADDTNFACP